MREWIISLWLTAFVLGLAGCAASDGPTVLVIDSAEYARVFDLAAEAARREGMMPIRRDRRAGVIETQPEYSASLLEPWRQDNAGFDQALENTVSLQRRRVRFEFVPAGAPPVQLPGGSALDGPRFVESEPEMPDLSTFDGPLELRVWVAVERSYRPGQRRSTWTRRYTSTPIGADLTGAYWVTVSRDLAQERRLLAQVERAAEGR